MKKGTRRLWIGAGALALSVALPISAVILSLGGWPAMQSPLFAFLLIGGMPEILCLLAIAILGQENYGSAAKRTRLLAPLAAPASRLRYYAGLLGCLLNGIPLWLYAYTPWLLPGGADKYIILAVADLVFIYSVFLMGGEFWEKFRRLFVWEGNVAKS